MDSQAFSALVERLDAAEVDSIGILGSTGTYMYLSRAERRRAVEAAHAVLKGRRTLMAGVGALRTDEAVALAKDAEAAGADALLLAPVSYTPLTQEGPITISPPSPAQPIAARHLQQPDDDAILLQR